MDLEEEMPKFVPAHVSPFPTPEGIFQLLLKDLVDSLF